MARSPAPSRLRDRPPRPARARASDLADDRPRARRTADDKAEAQAELEPGLRRGSTDLQDRLWAEHRHKVLVVLQGIDAAGKDGTIRARDGRVQPAGLPGDRRSRCRPTRSSPTTTSGGSTGASRARARSASSTGRHYEDVLIVRVHDLVPKERLVAPLRPDQRLRADAGRRGHDDRQVLPLDRPRRAARTLPGALRRPDEALEVPARRPRGAQALGRLHRRLRGRAVALLDRRGAVVRHPVEQEVVPQPRRRRDPGRHARRRSTRSTRSREDLPA